MIEVVRAGALTTVQDIGRAGWAHLGVPRSGALDLPALLAANALVANAPVAAGLETTVTGCELRALARVAVAVTGAPARVTVDGRPVAFGAPVALPASATLEVGRARLGVRSYVAVQGGIEVPPVLGSRSTDTLSGLGPAPLRDGDRLPVGLPGGTPGQGYQPRWPDEIHLRVTPGPRADWFTAGGWATLCGTPYTVSPLSNRVGVRLAGASLQRARTGELPSEGIVLGAVQVPANGQPLVFLADHPPTGGYPVIAVVDAADLPLLAQARPGATVTFHGPQC